MSRSFQYVITYKNNRKKTVAGAYNSHGADYFTSHFNGADKRRVLDDIVAFEAANKKAIKAREIVYFVSASQSALGSLHGRAPVDYAFPAFRKTFDSTFNRVNAFKGDWKNENPRD